MKNITIPRNGLMKRLLVMGGMLGMVSGLLWLSSPSLSYASGGSAAVVLSTTEADGELVVTATGLQLEDMYAYELTMVYDEERLHFIEAGSKLSGFTFVSTAEDGEVVLAYTKIGQAPGESGTTELATFVFERTAAGAPDIRLLEARLVDSELNMVVITTTAAVPDAVPALEDITGHWAEEEIRQAAEAGIVKGYPDGLFRPDQTVTRAEMVILIIRTATLYMDSGQIHSIEHIEDALFPKGDEDVPEWQDDVTRAAAVAAIISILQPN